MHKIRHIPSVAKTTYWKNQINQSTINQSTNQQRGEFTPPPTTNRWNMNQQQKSNQSTRDASLYNRSPPAINKQSTNEINNGGSSSPPPSTNRRNMNQQTTGVTPSWGFTSLYNSSPPAIRSTNRRNIFVQGLVYADESYIGHFPLGSRAFPTHTIAPYSI